MPFSKALAKTPTFIGTITVTLHDDGFANKGASYMVEIQDQDMNIIRVPGDLGDLVPYLSGADVAWLLDFMARLRTKAVDEFIG